MQKASLDVVELWNQKFLTAAEQIAVKSRHVWIHYIPEQITFTQFCLYKQCKHCKKFLILYVDKPNVGSLFFDKQYAGILTDKPIQYKLNLCERLLIMK